MTAEGRTKPCPRELLLEMKDPDNPMDVDDSTQDEDQESPFSSSLPTSFLTSTKSWGENRRLSTSTISSLDVFQETGSPCHTPHTPVMRSLSRTWTPTNLEHDAQDYISTPTRRLNPPATPTRPPMRPLRQKEKATMLGKHPQTPSPLEPRLRSKGFKSLPVNAFEQPPKLPDFSTPDTSGMDRSTPLYSPVARPDFGIFGSPMKSNPFGFFSRQPSAGLESNDGDNPFLGSSRPKARFEMDYLSESQWYSDYPHHITQEYVEELFNLEKRVMFTRTMSGLRDYPDYLSTHFYVGEPTLGKGEFSEVLKVQSKANKEYYAVKKLQKTVQGAMERKRYLTEVRNMWRVEKNPHVIELLEAWEQKGKIYMRLELCKLGSLRAAMKAQKKYGGFDEKRIWRCLTDLASGLRAIHDSSIIHMDFKPANVFITTTGSLKIGDFGLSISFPVQNKDIVEGDKCYMAQELLDSKCGKFSDIFSLGITIYEMVSNRSGDLPGEGGEWHRLRDDDVDVNDYLAEPETPSEPKASDTTTTVSTTADSNDIPTSGASLSLATASQSSPFSSSLSLPLQDHLLSQGQDTLAQAPKTAAVAGRYFSKELLDTMKEMMQSTFDNRPKASTLLSLPRVQAILTKRSEGPSKARTEQAMHGLLLQSI